MGLPWTEVAELSNGHTWAGGTGTRSCIVFLLPTRGYFQPLRSAGEAALQENSNTAQARSSHCYTPQRSPHHAARGCQHGPTVNAIPKSQPQQGQGQLPCTHGTSSGALSNSCHHF